MQSTKNDSTLTVTPCGKITGLISVPGDKSLSHRAVMMGAIAEGTTHIHHFLRAEDTLATLQVYQQLGVEILIENDINAPVTIQGTGLFGLKAAAHPLDFQNSGTGVRLSLGILAGQNFSSSLTGDQSLSKRPMSRVITPLQKMGASIESSHLNDEAVLPCQVQGRDLQAVELTTQVASAQVKSCLILAALHANGLSKIREVKATRNHTENLLCAFGVDAPRKDNSIEIQGQQVLKGCEVTIPGDISSAAFFLVAALLVKDSKLTLLQVGLNPLRTGIIQILRLMGANIEIENLSECSGELVGDIKVQSSELKGIEIPTNLISDAIDEFPIIMIAAAMANGTTTLQNAQELRYKESDRIHAMAVGLTHLGVQVQETHDGIVIHGGHINGGEVDSFGDHRVAMAFAVAGMVANEAVSIYRTDSIATSFPNFLEICQQLNIQVDKRQI